MAIGRPSQGIEGGVVVRIYVPRHTARALDTLAAATGEAKTSHLRRAVARYLADCGLIDLQQNTGLTPKPKEKK